MRATATCLLLSTKCFIFGDMKKQAMSLKIPWTMPITIVTHGYFKGRKPKVLKELMLAFLVQVSRHSQVKSLALVRTY